MFSQRLTRLMIVLSGLSGSLLPACEPEVVLMDINMPPGQSGIDAVRQLKPAHPRIEFIMLTVYEDTESVFNALAAGASGYLLKQATLEELLEAIQQAHAGGSPMSGHIARKVVQSFRRTTPDNSDTADLSDREQQVLELLAKAVPAQAENIRALTKRVNLQTLLQAREKSKDRLDAARKKNPEALKAHAAAQDRRRRLEGSEFARSRTQYEAVLRTLGVR